jgi:hypothetical protein
MKLNGKQYDKFILNGKTYEKFYLNNKIYQSLDPGLILDLPLQNNFTDYSANAISMVAGNTNGLPSFVAGRKGIDYAVNFASSKALKTAVNIALNTTNQMSISTWIKTTQTTVAIISELSSNSNFDSTFRLLINNGFANKIELNDHNSGFNRVSGNQNINTGSWFHIVSTINRNNGINQNKIYINNVLSFTQDLASATDNNGNFDLKQLFIGARNGNSSFFVGLMQEFALFNYEIGADKVDELYNA